ncbi:MAG: phosphoglycolate phosphatase, partial [Rhodoferax sp.]|nr:phosphoglycolate phosphatase [Rhodoferax sp.]
MPVFRNSVNLNQFDVDAVIVDLDGTMVDTLGDFCVALTRMLGDLPAPFQNQQVDRATVARLVGKGSEHLIKSVLALVDKAQPATKSGAFERPAAELQAPELEQLYRQAWPIYQRHYLAVNGQHA